MKFAYADPPYLGCCALYGHFHGDSGNCWDHIGTHVDLIDQLCDEYPDGWAMSGTSGSLRHILPHCPDEARVAAWVKPFASFKAGVGVAYAWEPVIFHGGRKRTREQPTVRDWVDENITLRRGLTGAKPVRFVHWMLDVLNVQPGDEVVDIFPGSGAVQDAIDGYFNRPTAEPGTPLEHRMSDERIVALLTAAIRNDDLLVAHLAANDPDPIEALTRLTLWTAGVMDGFFEDLPATWAECLHELATEDT